MFLGVTLKKQNVIKSTKQKRLVRYASDNSGQNKKQNKIDCFEKKNQNVNNYSDYWEQWNPFLIFNIGDLVKNYYINQRITLLECALKSGSLLEISNEFDLYCKYQRYFNQCFIMKQWIPEQYYPLQTQFFKHNHYLVCYRFIKYFIIYYYYQMIFYQQIQKQLIWLIYLINSMFLSDTSRTFLN
ncbi:unnamed protein product [Paramecium sonneborni]|uniref:Uncharacterized protein n=1 Tax=Paramecium sonneborni TaxID=65129 RepID=A0A8S1RD62_9CILI|nr:unnamed protein product [Paramecium sonneborni]